MADRVYGPARSRASVGRAATVAHHAGARMQTDADLAIIGAMRREAQAGSEGQCLGHKDRRSSEPSHARRR
jgi:hypothetical protein